ncbi:cytoplasmic 60S subunit biogenesis factor ZNF622-like [Ostrea edulis]|uniref:cytoplasmic 60S subunit biogenesis factor ZNF622-like n=1 Tax=Ostrea edulis TaxID=37623 RepID=UPI0024AF9A1A|nr:cytoplasmic 60S subunit biogenesis factor ZNF622-like [Ostrea edulis]
MSSGLFTCISCRVGFQDGNLQRAHYKTDWHRYNLKRKVATLPPVTAEVFQEKVLSQRTKVEEEQKVTSHICQLCSKHFSSENAFQNHIQSKRHRDLVSKVERQDGEPSQQGSNTIISTPKQKDAINKQIKQEMERTQRRSEEAETQDLSSSEEEWEGEALGLEECLFCSSVSSSMENNLNHMSVKHGFYLPDADFLVDLEGMVSYLGEKVGEGHMCLWCGEKGKTFHSVQAVQKHMLDKGHCKINFDRDAALEFVDFYDYRKSYPDGGDVAMETDDEVKDHVLDTEGYELVLPSGATIGHRSLWRYYKQNLPQRSSEGSSTVIPKMLAQYRALGWTGASGEVAQTRVKDLAYMQRMKNRQQMKLSTKANKFQPHFRSDVAF